MLSGIYTITCLTTDKGYLGSSINIPSRWKKHLRSLRKGNHANRYLQNSYNKYGESSLQFKVIEELSGLTEKEIREVEQIYLDQMDWSTSFNICKDSRGGEVTDEANQRRKESLKEFHRNNPDAVRGENNPFFGQTHTQEVKDFISETNTGLKRSEEFKKTKSELMSSRKGQHHRKEYLDELSEKYSGEGNPMAVSVTVNGVTYPTKKQALTALGLKYGYQLSRILNAERLSREGVESSDSKRVSPSDEG